MFEIETTQEIWRTKETTFTVIYPLPSIAYIKGMRGHFTREMYREIHRKMKERNVTDVYFERKKNDVFITKHIIV